MTLRIALYSDQVHPGNHAMDERLLRLIDLPRPRIGYVSSAPNPGRTYFEDCRRHYHKMGAALCCYVDELNCDVESVFSALTDCDAIHLSGGNTYSFLAWLQRSGRLQALGDYARRGGVLVGVSAGAILMTQNIDSAALCGDLRNPAVQDLRGLSLVSFSFLPHCEATGASSARIEAPEGLPMPLCACPDGSGLIVDGLTLEAYGAPLVLR